MADVDTRLKRQSATCILVPSMLSGVYPSDVGVVQAERQAVSWMYSGITAEGGVVAGAWLRRMRLWLIILTEEENGTFCY